MNIAHITDVVKSALGADSIQFTVHEGKQHRKYEIRVFLTEEQLERLDESPKPRLVSEAS